jgi:hypothetical protein
MRDQPDPESAAAQYTEVMQRQGRFSAKSRRSTINTAGRSAMFSSHYDSCHPAGVRSRPRDEIIFPEPASCLMPEYRATTSDSDPASSHPGTGWRIAVIAMMLGIENLYLGLLLDRTAPLPAARTGGGCGTLSAWGCGSW